MLSDRQEHVQEWIWGITSYPELQQISTAPKSQRFHCAFFFPYPSLVSLVFCVPVLQHLPTLGKGSGRGRDKRRAIGIYLDTFSAYIRKTVLLFLKINLKQCLTATMY